MRERRVSRRAFHAAALGLAAAGPIGCGAGAREPGGDPFGPGADLQGRRVFPETDPWNREVLTARVDPRSPAYLARVGLDKPLHPEFGTTYHGAPNGIPYTVVPGGQARVPVRFARPEESDPGPYPLPPDAPVEGGPKGDGDRHVLVVDRDRWTLYELFDARPEPGGGWSAGSGAVFDLKAGTTRPEGWTSADAAGLPIFPGLVRYDEAVIRRLIPHALRFTVAKTRRAYAPPARHFASALDDADLMPMGARLRLRPTYDTRKFPPQARVVLNALKTYGMLLADNGGDLFVSGAPDPRWDDDDLGAMKRVKVRDFEVVLAPGGVPV